MDTALILIDVQELFRQRPCWVEAQASAFLDRTNALVEGSRARGIPIVRILHSDGPDETTNRLPPGPVLSGRWRDSWRSKPRRSS